MMLISILRKVYLVHCSDELTMQIKTDVDRFWSASVFDWYSYDSMTQDMRGYSVIYGGSGDDVKKYTNDTAVIILSESADFSLIKDGFVDVLKLPMDDERFQAAFSNMIRRAELRRYLDIRTNLLSTYFDLSSDMLWTKDMRDYHMDVNHVLIDLVGKPRDEVEGKHEREIYGLSDDEKGCSESDSYVRETGLLFSSEESMPSADGKLHHLQVKKTAWRDGQNRIIGSIGLAKDVTELKNQQTQFICFLNSLDLSIVLTDNEGVITRANSIYLQIVAEKENEILGRNFEEITAPVFLTASGYEKHDRLVKSSHGGKAIWHVKSFRLKDYWGKQTGYAYVFQNVTAEREHSVRIRNMAVRDQLTDLANRAGMYEYFDTLDKNEKAAFMFVDVDNFKQINDRFGHGMGDRFLKDLAGIFRMTDNTAFVTRLGGDEFFIILKGKKSREKLREEAGELLKAVKNLPDYPEEVRKTVSLSIGVLPDFSIYNGVDEAIQYCDALMYTAKKSGKNQYYMMPEGEDGYVNLNIDG